MINNVKKITGVLLLLILMCTLTSCLDIIQTVSIRDGRYYVCVKCGFDKNMLYLAGMDEDSLNEELDKYDASFQNEKYNYFFEKTDVGNEIGFFMKFDCSADEDVTSDLCDFIPYQDKKGLKFPLVLGTEMAATQIEDTLDIALTVLSVTNFKLIADKNIIKEIESAVITDKDGRHPQKLKFYDFGEYYQIDVPINVLYTSKWTYTDIVLK